MSRWTERFLPVVVGTVLLVACGPSQRSITRLKLLVSSDGMYRVTAATLRSAQVDVGAIDLNTLQVFHRDQEVAVRVTGAGDSLALDFFGEATDSPYSAFNAYRLTWGARRGKRMREEPARASSGGMIHSYRDTLHLTRPSLFIPQPGDLSNSWFWQVLTAPVTTTVPIDLTEATSDPAVLHINVFASSQDAANPDHHLRAFFNDVSVADVTWDGQGARAFDATIPAGSTRPASNSLRLTAVGDTKAAADVVLLHSIDITYTRRLAVGREAIFFRTGTGPFEIEAVDGKEFELFDISDPGDPLHVSSTGGAAGTIESIGTGGDSRRWLALPSSAYRTPDRMVPMPRTDVRERTGQADYVIITHPDFVQSLQPLVDWRAKHGLRVAVATANEIYDEFGYGQESPQALRAFLDFAKPRYALLVGKASYDYRDYLHGPNKNLVPTFLVETPSLNQAASDDWFAAGPLSLAPSFAIGRIPAETAEQVSRVVAKVIAYESNTAGSDWRRRAIFIADDKEETFASLSDSLASKSERRIRSDKIYLAAHQGNVDATRAEFVPKWNEGAFVVTYVGHGSLDTWAEGPMLSSANVHEIQNGERLPILVTPTCLDGFFYHPYKDSLAEDLLFSERGGIIAGIVPTGLSTPGAQGELIEALYAGIFEDDKPTLGDALVHAKRRIDSSLPETREASQTFVLLGDPALGLPGF